MRSELCDVGFLILSDSRSSDYIVSSTQAVENSQEFLVENSQEFL